MTEFDPRLHADRVLPDPAVAHDLRLLRAEVDRFALQMVAARGRAEDIPPMFFSAVPYPDQVNPAKFKAQNILVISVGGTTTRFAAFNVNPVAIESLRTDCVAKMATPCQDGGDYAFADMLAPILEHAVAWYRAVGGAGHIVLNWGFPQLSYRLDPAAGITGAYALRMTKGQLGVRAEGVRIEEVCRDGFFALLGEQPDVKFSVQNDTVMSVHRYLAPETLHRYHKLALMIMGTGVNVTTAEPFVIDKWGTVQTDSGGYAIRRRADENGKQSHQFWINYEAGKLVPAETRAPCDRLFDGESADDGVESYGLGGTGYPRLFANLMTDYLVGGDKLWARLIHAHPDIDAAWITALSLDKRWPQGSPLNLNPGLVGQLAHMADVVVRRNRIRAAEVLAAVCLSSGLGLHNGAKPDALAMEGSLWKTPGHIEAIRRTTEVILEPELTSLGRTDLNLSFIAEDDYNASVLGPAYFVGIHDR